MQVDYKGTGWFCTGTVYSANLVCYSWGEHTVPLHISYNLSVVCECTLWAECAQYFNLLPLTGQTSQWSLFVSAWWSTVFAALLGLPLVSRWRCLSFPALSVRFLTKHKWQFLWQIGFWSWWQNPAVQNGQVKQMKEQFFHPFQSTAIHRIAISILSHL